MDLSPFPRRIQSWLFLGVLAGCAGCGESAEPQSDGRAPTPEIMLAPALPAGVDLDPGLVQALEAARSRVAGSPDSPQLRLELGMAFDASSLHEPALEAYRQVLQLDADHVRAHYHTARMLRELGQFTEARESLDRVLSLDKSYAPAHRRSASWYTLAGKFDDAEKAYAMVQDLQVAWPDGLLGLAHVALASERSADAESMVRQVLARHPEHRYAHYLLGSALRDQGKLEAAEAAFAVAAGAVPTWTDPWVDEVESWLAGNSRLLVEAQACLEAGRFEEASKRLAVLHEAAPDDVTIQGMWTAALTKLGRHEEALDMLQAASARQPDHFRIELNLAIVRWKQGDHELALEHLKRAIALNSAHEAIYMVQGQVLRDFGDAKSAVRAFEKALALGAAPQRVLPSIGQLHMGLQDWNAAVSAYRRATVDNPTSAALYATLAGCQVEAGDLDGARAALARAQAIDPAEKLIGMVAARIVELEGGK